MLCGYSQEWRDSAKCDKVAIAQNVSLYHLFAQKG